MQHYDIIGDIHGHAKELIKLLKKLDYELTETGYRHESRKVIFLGDFIDGGEHLAQHRELLNIVIPMVENGHAEAVLGNHEFNALAYHTKHNGEYLRPHTEKNTKQHQAFLNEFESDLELKQSVLQFFHGLPLWLDLGSLRVVHACWDERRIDVLQQLTSGNRLTKELLIQASQEGSLAYEAIETLLKGVEVDLPNGVSFKDKDGNTRHTTRVQWWNNQATTLADIMIEPDLELGEAGGLPVPDDVPVYAETNPPCFIGHYWLNSKPSPLSHNIACLDYSVAKGGKLTAYRWSGENTLRAENFVSV